MKHPITALILCAAALTGAACAGVPDHAGAAAAAVRAIDQTDRLIVKYRDAEAAAKGAARVPALDNARQQVITRAGQSFGVTMRALHTTATGAHVLQLSRRLALADAQGLARELMARDPNVEYAEPDRILQKMSTPNDPRYSEQWHYFDTVGGIRANTAWDKSTGAGVVVAVIDTGYRPHADLTGQILPGYDFISTATWATDGEGRDSDARDPGDAVVAGECGTGVPAQDQSSSWHGTHVAGTIAALTNNGAGVAGVAYGAKVLPVRVLGKCGGYTSDIADGIIWASGGAVTGVPANANRARVINMSLGGSGACDSTTQAAINSARSRGTVVVVAAGNSNVNASNANPANCAGVIAVAATNKLGGKAPYSNYGTIVDVAAPGGDANGYILSTLNSGATVPASDSYAYYQGTSMATPHVAATAALMLSKNPGLTPDDVEAKLKSTARAFPQACSGCGAGIINAAAAVDAAIAATSAPTMNETEPNDTMSTWNQVTTSGTVVNGTMGSSTDNDYFLVQLPAGRTLTATLTMSSTSNDFDLYGYNASGSLIASSTNGAGSTDAVTITNSGTTTSPRYIRVKFYSGGTGATAGKYTLKLTW
jgi:serine protease